MMWGQMQFPSPQSETLRRHAAKDYQPHLRKDPADMPSTQPTPEPATPVTITLPSWSKTTWKYFRAALFGAESAFLALSTTWPPTAFWHIWLIAASVVLGILAFAQTIAAVTD